MKVNPEIESFIQDIQRYEARLKFFLDKVKNPVHHKTGKPLSIRSIQGYKSIINALKGLIIKTEERMREKS